MTAPSPAQLLAAVLRVVAPSKEWIPDSRASYVFGSRGGPWGYGATNKDDLARVVAMLTPEQRERFSTRLWIEARKPMAASVSAADLVTAPTSIWLAALVAATGVEA